MGRDESTEAGEGRREIIEIKLEVPAEELLARVTYHAYLRRLNTEALSARTEDLRKAVREAQEAGVPKKMLARAAGVSRPTVDKWLEK